MHVLKSVNNEAMSSDISSIQKQSILTCPTEDSMFYKSMLLECILLKIADSHSYNLCEHNIVVIF